MLKSSLVKCFAFRRLSTNARKVVVITGCDTGLGFTLAERCLSEKAIVLAGCLNNDGAGAQYLQKHGALICRLDVTKDDHIERFKNCLAETLTKYDCRLHAVVNNAGVMIMGEYEWLTSSMIAQQVNVNLLGALNVTHAFLPHLRTDQGRVINIVSHCALVGLPFLSVYGATKAALLNWSDALRIEQAKYGVQVVSFIPGSFHGESGIMAQQTTHAREMLEKMPRETKSFHKNYFETVQQYLSYLPKPTKPKALTDQALNQKLTHAVFSANPRRVYRHEPIRYTLYHTLFKIFPGQMRDSLIERFVSFPKYH